MYFSLITGLLLDCLLYILLLTATFAHTLATEGAVAEQMETVWTGLRERHVGQICGKERERLRLSATGFFDWKNIGLYFSDLALYSYEHSCKKCKGRMKVIKQNDLELKEGKSPEQIISNIPCLKCKTPLSLEGMIMWD